MPYFDTHCHLDDPQFDADRDGLIERARAAGVEYIVAVGTTAASSRTCVELARRYQPTVVAAVGIQPNHCAEVEAGDWDRIVELAAQAEVVAVGETGLDRYWDFTPFAVQQDYFERHLRLSRELGRPFIVHLRDCEAEVLEMLRAASAHGPLQGVMHSFTGTREGAQECLALGLYISFAGMVTYKKSEELRAIAAAIPDDRILIETDAPYLSPHPKRGQRPNEPALLVHTAEQLASVRGLSSQEFGELTTANARRLFGLPAR